MDIFNTLVFVESDEETKKTAAGKGETVVLAIVLVLLPQDDLHHLHYTLP